MIYNIYIYITASVCNMILRCITVYSCIENQIMKDDKLGLFTEEESKIWVDQYYKATNSQPTNKY